MSTVSSELLAGVLAGKPRPIGRAISWIENRHPEAPGLLASLYGHTGRAMTIGVTGPPGAGKSTFVDRLVAEIRQAGKTVGVVAVDPASPFSGGAILGDRVRMLSPLDDAGVFIRSMSSRGHLGGIALATEAAVNVLDAAGFDVVIVETVGVGQSEIEVAQLADTTLLVQPPGLGDGIQAVKAGIMEVPALFVINKADLPGARQAAAAIGEALELTERTAAEWAPPVILVKAVDDAAHNTGAVWAAIQAHWEHLRQEGRLEAVRAERASELLWREAERLLFARLRARVAPETARAWAERIAERRVAPHEAAEALLGEAGEPPPACN